MNCPIDLDCQYFHVIESFVTPGRTICSNSFYCKELAEPLPLPYEIESVKNKNGSEFNLMTVETLHYQHQNTREDLKENGWKESENYDPPLLRIYGSDVGFKVCLNGTTKRKKWLKLQGHAHSVCLPYFYYSSEGLSCLEVRYSLRAYGFMTALSLPYNVYWLEDGTRVIEVLKGVVGRYCDYTWLKKLGYDHAIEWDIYSEIKKLKDGCLSVEVSQQNGHEDRGFCAAENLPYRATYKRKDKYLKLTVLRKEGDFLPAVNRTPWKFRGLICFSYINKDCIPENLCFKKDLKKLGLKLSEGQIPRAYYHSRPYHQKIPLWDKNECS